MRIRKRGQNHARHFQSGILIVAGTALLITPALGAGPVGAGGPPPVVAPKAPPVATPTAPVIPQMPVVPNNIPSPITAAPGGVTGTAKGATADDANSGTARRDTTATNGSGTTGTAQGISDQAASGNLTSFLRTPITPSTPQRQEQNNKIPGLDVVVLQQPAGTALHVTTDGKGLLSVGKLTRGETYHIQISGKDLEPVLDRVAGGKTNGGTAQPQQVLIALLLPAVQKVGTLPSGPYSRAFARGSKDQAIRLTLAIAKDGKATVDWGDGKKLALGNIKNGTPLNLRFTTDVAVGDVNGDGYQMGTARGGTAPTNGTTPVKQADVNSTIDQVGTARSSTAPTNGTKPVKQADVNATIDQVATSRSGTVPSGTTPAKQADVNNVISEVGTARSATASTNGTAPVKQADVNTTVDQVSTARSGTAPTNGTTPVAQADANTAMSQVSTTRLGTAPTNGTTPVKQADVNNVLSEVSTTRLGTAPTNGTTPVKRADANAAIGDVSTTRLGTAPTKGPTPVAREDVNNVLSEVSTTRLGTAPTNGTAPVKQADANSAMAEVSTTRLGTAPTSGTTPPNNPIPSIGFIVHKQPTSKGLHVTTDGKGTASIGKLARGESYDIQFSGKDLDQALNRVAGGKTGGGAVLIALLLPAVQQAREARSMSASSAEHSFARGSKDQAIHLTIAMAKDGTVTVDWGDGSGKLSLGEYHGNTSVNMGLKALMRGDANSVVLRESQTR